ncbi:HD domain-containing protein [Clostridium sp. SYSU_GA19001]|uniref:HD domain-containing protein n=1 Tax=Clostridium caldaquaticum TaxID=2940653 RepID=UPI002076EDA8|nr:HD domain-containing protein [Clostridium caldaquaticum]MCM8710924.1 HD domain-containing protein [Clostridium caldaquaticum]
MERVNLILSNNKFKEYLNKINQCEIDRDFCRHDINHFMDVARISYILILEKGLSHTKEEVYAAALLHDIGKWQQYESKIPHEIASAKLAYDILINSDFNEEEINKIISSIKNHRNENNIENTLDHILFTADKLSRACFMCKAEKECYWAQDKKNLKIYY